MKSIFKKIVVSILRSLARLVIKKYKPKVVTITGSVGKTSTKDAIALALARESVVRKSKKSYNSEIGLPLTILGVPNGWNNPLRWIENILAGLSLVLFRHKYPTWLVLEVGIGKPGDMARTAAWLHSDIVVITHFGTTPVHVEFFPSKEDVIREKTQLINTLKSEGLLVLNADEESVRALRDKYRSFRSVTYGLSSNADVHAILPQILYKKGTRGKDQPVGMTFRVETKGNSIPVTIEGGIGTGHLSAPLAALAIAEAEGRNMVEAARAFEGAQTLAPGRMRLIEGQEGSVIIDDTYNASPVAMDSALETLASIETEGRRIAVLGDMLELGRHTDEEHKKAGALVAKSRVQILLTVGPRAIQIAEGAREAGFPEDRIVSYRTSAEVIAPLTDLIGDTDIILVKGSQGMRMERIVEAIMAHPEDAEKLLCRQDPEWKKR